MGLASAWWLGAEEGLEAEFEVAHAQDALDGAFAQFAGKREDVGRDGQKLLVLLFHAIQFACLRGRRLFRAPAVDLLGVDVDEFHLLGVHLFDPINGSVVEHMRLSFCPGQRAQVLARVVQRILDHAGYQIHLADRLPVYLVGFWHVGFPLLQAMTGSAAASAARQQSWPVSDT